MATIEICDICRTNKNVKRHQYTTGKVYNGVDYDDEGEIIDLCTNCELNLYKSAVTNLITSVELGVVSTARERLNKAIIDAFKCSVKKAP